MIAAREVAIEVGAERVTGLVREPADARALFVLAHGAGAGMRHPFLEALSESLARRAVATLRYSFVYTERGERRPDPQPKLLAAVRAAIAAGKRLAGERPVVAGGKSMGGRMTTLAASEGLPDEVAGLVLVGFPLHPAGRPATARAEHLERVREPMLFLQGTRDALAEIGRMRGVCERLGPRATLEVFEDADHSFHVPKRAGTTDAEVIERLADTIARWTAGIR